MTYTPTPGMGTDYSFHDGGQMRQGVPIARMAMDVAPPRSTPRTAPSPPAPRIFTADRKITTDMAADTTTKALSALVALLQKSMPSTDLDDIDTMLNGVTDPDTGMATDAATRKARRSISESRMAADKQADAGRLERFPNADRLSR